ncbi:MAG: hypothetical protein JW797_02790 [Bradymonadales bacterium]|nr:hypothetical protein [Bradymonadales bacterium]
MTTLCLLTIRTPEWSISLTGQTEFVSSTYQAMRHQLLRHLATTRNRLATDRFPAGKMGADATERGPAVPPSEPLSDRLFWVYHSNDLYNKVHVTRPEDLARSPLYRHVALHWLTRIYLEDDPFDRLARLVPSGSTLWSELTALGRARLRPR